ncbi:hypothetical protein [Kordia jejudonensis]|uniref:hypothetical protein n=1 Tax=Kordia jejudonensis TaxID=1348245 RepID=UPI0006996128|nr:hypothetical protein [Kordia jejudonensis]
MLTQQEMLTIAEHYMSFSSDKKIEFTLYYESIIRKEYGNIYKYDSKKYIKTGDFKYHVPGSAPFLVEKETGRVVNFGTAYPLEFYLDEYENGNMTPSLNLYWYPDTQKYHYK